eukprot:jgi/Tetstr1/465101/TSEL_009828.t1
MDSRQRDLALPGLGSVDLGAVRKQLQLLGHDVPDHVIHSFLSEMAVEGEPAPAQDDGRRASKPAVGRDAFSDEDTAEEPVEECRAARVAHFEEALYGEHDRYLWEASGGGLQAEGYREDAYGVYSDSFLDDEVAEGQGEEAAGLEVDFRHLQVSKAEMRRPMEVKNVWLSNTGNTGKAGKKYRPVTPEVGPSRREKERREQRQRDGTRGQAAAGHHWQGTPRRPETVPGPVDRPSWDDSAILGRRRTAQHGPHPADSPRQRPLTPAAGGGAGNGSFIIASRQGKKAVKATAPKKVDRVARNRAMADTWKKDKFLSHGGTARAAARPACNFYQYFSEQHAAVARERQEVSREVRANTVKSLRSGGGEAPQEKRRDHLRFEVRSWMNSY